MLSPSSKTPEERLAVMASCILTGMCIIVLYRQNKSLFDGQVRELRAQWYKLEDWLKERPWPRSKMWLDVKDAMDNKAIDP